MGFGALCWCPGCGLTGQVCTCSCETAADGVWLLPAPSHLVTAATVPASYMLLGGVTVVLDVGTVRRRGTGRHPGVSEA